MYSFSSRVRFSEVDKDQRMSLHAILNYFQDCSIFHSNHVHKSIDELTQMGYAWVMASWQVIVERYPKLGEEIRISTWAYGFKGFYGYRNFTLEDAEGTVCAYANTIWTFLDLNTMHPARITKEIQNAYGFDAPYPMDKAPRKIAVPEGDVLAGEPVHVSASQTDVYRHMNNAVYVQLAQELLPEEFCIRQMRAEYRSAAVAGDMIYPVLSLNGDRQVVRLNRKDGEPYAVVEFEPAEDKIC